MESLTQITFRKIQLKLVLAVFVRAGKLVDWGLGGRETHFYFIFSIFI